MLYIVTTNHLEVPWRVGNAVPEGLNVTEVVADGDELKVVRTLCKAIAKKGSASDGRRLRVRDRDAVMVYDRLKRT